jgi:hypothetical protein
MTNLTNDVALRALPELYSTEGTSDPIAPVRLVLPGTEASWWLTEYSPQKRIAFGFCTLGDHQLAELGYVSLDELIALRSLSGAKVERDRRYNPIRISQVRGVLGI